VSMYYTAVKGEPYSRPDFLGKNPPAGGLITTWLKSELKDKVKMNIKDDSGRVVSDMNLAQGAGVQRDVWNLQFVPEAPDGKKYPAAGSVMGALPTVKPGIYTLEVDAAGAKASGTIEVRPDPRIGFREDQWALQTRAVGGILLTSKKMALAVTAARTVRRHLDSVLPEIDKMGEKGKALRSTLDPFFTAFSRIERGIVPGEFEALQATLEGALRGGSLSIQILTLASSIASFPQAPTADQTAEIAEISALVDDAVAGLNGMIKTDIPRLNEALKAGSLKPFPDIQEIKVQGI
jgi:hypothetical protein